MASRRRRNTAPTASFSRSDRTFARIGSGFAGNINISCITRCSIALHFLVLLAMSASVLAATKNVVASSMHELQIVRRSAAPLAESAAPRVNNLAFVSTPSSDARLNRVRSIATTRAVGSTSRLFGSTSNNNNFNSNSNSNRNQRQSQSQSSTTRIHPRKLDKASATTTAATDGTANGSLSWETFDFSTNPKLDNRFAAALEDGDGQDDNDDGDGQDGQSLLNKVARGEASRQDFARVIKLEAQKDETTSKKFDNALEAYQSLSPQLVSQATAILEPYINEQRLERIYSILEKRTKRTRFLFENPSNPSNVWACLRTIDSFGIQNVDVIIDSGMYEGKMAISQKSGMRTAMGSAKWLTLRNHMSTREAVERIRAQGYTIYASDLNPDSVDVRDLDWNEAEPDATDNGKRNNNNEKKKDGGPICVVMGNEERGISDEMRQLADVTFTLPMCGFAESFNLSVATSITLAHMSAKSDGGGRGPLRPGDLDEHELACLKLKGLLGSLPQRRMGKSLLKQKGVVLPDAIMALL